MNRQPARTAMIIAALAVLIAAARIVIGGGSPEQLPLVALSGEAMGTGWSIRIAGVAPEENAAALAAGVQQVLDEIDGLMSTWKPTSEVSLFNANDSTDWIPLSRATVDVLAAAEAVSRRSDGAFDVTVGPLVDAYGVGSRPTTAPPSADELARARASVGWRGLTVRADPPAARKSRGDTAIDLSALAKGYAVDRVVEFLTTRGHPDVLVELGGEVAARGRHLDGTPWQVGIENPASADSDARCVVRLVNEALATSGDYRRYVVQDGVRLSHIVDPRDGLPVRHELASASVVAPTAMLADAWATALMVLGPEAGLATAHRERLPVLLLSRDGDDFVESRTPWFQAEDAGGRTGITKGVHRSPDAWIHVVSTFVLLLLMAGALGWRHAARRPSCLSDCESKCAGRPAISLQVAGKLRMENSNDQVHP